jgi:hypothetical protein
MRAPTASARRRSAVGCRRTRSRQSGSLTSPPVCSSGGMNLRRRHATLWRTLGRRGGTARGPGHAEARPSPLVTRPAGLSTSPVWVRPTLDRSPRKAGRLPGESSGGPAGLVGWFPRRRSTVSVIPDHAGPAARPRRPGSRIRRTEARHSGSSAVAPTGDAGCSASPRSRRKRHDRGAHSAPCVNR